jgi:methylated-DNA-[protein]-cysteine S-methyltransferase
MLLNYDEFESPIGHILFASDGDSICMLDFDGYEERMTTLLRRRFGACEFKKESDPQNLKTRLKAYFGGDLHSLDDVPVRGGGSEFQEQVWRSLREIPAGETWSYGQLARRVNRPQAARAVGHANSQNPIAIIVPCHRVIGASSKLVGYGGGLHRKEWLLRHEGALRQGSL